MGLEFVLLVLVVGIGALSLWSIKRTRTIRESTVGESLPLADRGLLAPLKRLAADLESAVAANKASTAVQILGQEAINDAQTILRKAESMLMTRHELKRTLRSRYESEKAAKVLEQMIADAQDDSERTTLSSALAARQLELGHYDEAEQGIARIEAGLKQAEAAVAEIKTRLSLLGSQDREKAGNAADDLREALGRVRAIGESFEETQQLFG